MSAPIGAGCAAPRGVSACFPDAYARTFRAVEEVLGAHALARREPDSGRIETDWIERPARRTQGLLLEGHYVERLRFIVDVNPADQESSTEVWLGVEREERPPGGSRALRWTRTEPPEGLGRELLAAILRRLDAIRALAASPH